MVALTFPHWEEFLSWGRAKTPPLLSLNRSRLAVEPQSSSSSGSVNIRSVSLMLVIHTSGESGLFSHLEFSPQENLTVRRGSVQRHPLIQDQLWFGEQLPRGDYERSHWLVPRTRKLHRNTVKVKGERVCVWHLQWWTDTENHTALTFTMSISSLGS